MHSSIRWLSLIGGAIIVVAAALDAALIVPAAGTGPEGITSFSGGTAGAVVYSTNSSTGTAIEGATGTVAGGKALWGLANNALNAGTGVRATAHGPNSFGLYAEATSTNKAKPSYGLYATSKSSYAVDAFTSVAGLTSLLAYNSDATSNGSHALRAQSRGDAITALSTNNNAVVGQTSATPTPMPSAVFARAGILGQDTTSSYNNAGVAGTSTYSNGVLGQSSIGGSGNGGVTGISLQGHGVKGNSSSWYGVLGNSDSGTGVGGFSNTKIGVYAYSAATPVPSPGPGCCFNITALVVYSAGGAPLMIGNTQGTDKMSLDASGNLILAGGVTTGSPLVVVHRALNGRTVGAYSAQQSAPTIEDTGEARLVNGQSYVRLDPAFAELMDPRANYLVFITPQGESRGLFVTQKTRQGFLVRENLGGRATLAFDYRIVAKPYDAAARRLPLVQTFPQHPVAPLAPWRRGRPGL